MMQLSVYKEHYKETIRLGVPIMLGQLGIIVVGFADNIMVGHHSTAELAAASFVNNFFNLVFIAGMGFSYGLTPIIGGYFAQKEYAKAGETLKNSLCINLFQKSLGKISFCLLVIEAVLRIFADSRKCYVSSKSPAHDQTFLLTILRKKDNSFLHCVRRLFDMYFFSFQINLSFIWSCDSTDALYNLCTTCTNQTCKTYDLASAYIEGNIFEISGTG